MLRQLLCTSTLILSGLIFTITYAAPTQLDGVQTQRSHVSQNHQADFNLFISLMEQVDMQKMTIMAEEDNENITQEQKAQVADVIKNLQALSQSLAQAQFITVEGQKVQAAFMAYNDDSIYLLKNQQKWENDQKQKEKLIAHSMQLNQTLIDALQNLKVLAGQE